MLCPLDAEPLADMAPVPFVQDGQNQCSNVQIGPSERLLFPAQIGRVSFVVRFVLFLFAVWLGKFLSALGGRMSPGASAMPVLLLSLFVLFFSLIYFMRYGVVARLRDIGMMNSEWCLLIFVPVVNVVFLGILVFEPRNGFKKQSAGDAA